MTDRLATLAAAAEAVAYHTSLGIRVDQLAADHVRLRIPYKEENSNPGRALHGGVYASAIDVAGVLAAWSGVDAVADLECRTLDLTVCYLAAAIDESIVAEARVRRRGKELAYVGVDVRSEAGKEVATGLVTHRMAPPAAADRRRRTTPPVVVEAPAAGTRDVPKLAGTLMAVPFIAARGMRFVVMRDGVARIEMPWAEGHADHGGRVHEGAIAALVDTAGAMASWSIVGLNFSYKASTVAIHVSIHEPATSGDLVAHARVLSRDNESFLATVAVTDATGSRTVATGSVTYRIVIPD